MLLLSWWPEPLEKQRSVRVKLRLTQEEIADMLGMTRVTISQMFSEFERKQLLDLSGKTLVIRNRSALLKIVPGSISEVTSCSFVSPPNACSRQACAICSKSLLEAIGTKGPDVHVCEAIKNTFGDQLPSHRSQRKPHHGVAGCNKKPGIAGDCAHSR